MSPVPEISVCISTRDRAAHLERLLESLAAAKPRPRTEILVVDNGSRDHTAALLARWAEGGEGRLPLSLPTPGKSRALNLALATARAEVLAFTDDDVRVDPGWLQAVHAFFRQHPEYDAGVGQVLREDLGDPAVDALLERFSTLAFFSAAPGVRDHDRLHGANMALRRRAFERVGGFDERLGPGASGGLEDIDLGRRLRQAGLRIGLMPDAVVVHAVDVTRLNREHLLRWHLNQAQSLVTMKPEGLFWHALPRLLEALGAYGLRALTGSPRRDHAWGRVRRYTEMLRLLPAAGRGRSAADE